MRNATYDSLKWVALLGLPAVATFYATVGTLWGLPQTTAVVATITAFDTMLGTMLGISSAKHNIEVKGQVLEAEVPPAVAGTTYPAVPLGSDVSVEAPGKHYGV